MSFQTVSNFPTVAAVTDPDGTSATLAIAGIRQSITSSSADEAVAKVIQQVQEKAASLGRPLRLWTLHNDAETVLIVPPEGAPSLDENPPRTGATPLDDLRASLETAEDATEPAPTTSDPLPPVVTPAPVTTPPAEREAKTTAKQNATAPAESTQDVAPQTDEPILEATPAEAPEPAPRARRAVGVPISESTTFLAPQESQHLKATRGWKGAMNALGLNLDASEEEKQLARDVDLLATHWNTFKTIAVVNRKGGANKTPTVALLAAAFARASGGVVAWDNNESQGTLGWRTESAGHNRSVLDIVEDSTSLLEAASPAALTSYVHHQKADRYDVVRSDQDEQGDHEVTADDVDIAHSVLRRFYRLAVMDSGNTARSANWKKMIELTDQLVVPMTATEDRAEAARLTLTTLWERGGHSRELAQNSVAIISEATDTGAAAKETRLEAQRIAETIAPYVREVHTIPFDPAMRAGHLRWDALRPATQDAWVRAAAAVARGLNND